MPFISEEHLMRRNTTAESDKSLPTLPTYKAQREREVKVYHDYIASPLCDKRNNQTWIINEVVMTAKKSE